MDCTSFHLLRRIVAKKEPKEHELNYKMDIKERMTHWSSKKYNALVGFPKKRAPNRDLS